MQMRILILPIDFYALTVLSAPSFCLPAMFSLHLFKLLHISSQYNLPSHFKQLGVPECHTWQLEHRGFFNSTICDQSML